MYRGARSLFAGPGGDGGTCCCAGRANNRLSIGGSITGGRALVPGKQEGLPGKHGCSRIRKAIGLSL